MSRPLSRIYDAVRFYCPGFEINLAGVHYGDGTGRREDADSYQRGAGFSSAGTDGAVLGAGMIQLTPQMRILLSIKAVDFRKGIDGLAEICRHILGTDPFSGCVFVFRNQRATAIKALMYDGQGFWLCQKRLSKGTFQWWPDKGADRVSVLAVHELQLLLWNGDPSHVRVAPLWRKIAAEG